MAPIATVWLYRKRTGGIAMTKPVSWNPTTAEALERLKGRLFATTAEAGAVLSCCPRTVRRAIEEGDIPAVKTGTHYRVPVAWLRDKTVEGSSLAATKLAI